MTRTTNFKLRKPGADDFYNIEDFNANADILDEQLGGHMSDDKVHVTAEEKAGWNAKAELTDIPTKLPADGGNADTLEGLRANEIACNPNLLINPDFKINQRSKSGTVAVGEYAADMWKLESGTAEVLSDGTINLNGTLSQKIENPPAGNTICSVSAGTAAYSNGKFTITASGETISWAKLEVGNSATPFLPTDPATELMKCQRYFVRYGTAYGWFGTGFTSATNRARISQVLPVPLRSWVTRPTVTVHGTLYINTPTKLGVDALILGDFIDSPIIQNNNLCMGFVIPDGTGTVESCYGQLRDNDSYIDISAEL